MKPLRPFRPEPPPRKTELWTVAVALALMTIGVGFGLYGFHDAGTISAEAFLAIMSFVVALSAGVILGIDLERKPPGRAGKRFDEVPPPFDLYTVWPPLQDRESETRRPSPPAARGPGPSDKP